MLLSSLVLVPPGIVGENKPEDVKVREKHRVTLTCEVIGKSVQYYFTDQTHGISHYWF